MSPGGASQSAVVSRIKEQDQHGDKLGPSYEQLRNAGKSNFENIVGAGKTSRRYDRPGGLR